MPNKINDGGPAFPGEYHPTAREIMELHEKVGIGMMDAKHQLTAAHPGMSLRDWFAGQAPNPSSGWIETRLRMEQAKNPHNEPDKHRPMTEPEVVAEYKFRFADAMLAEREKQG